MKRVSLWLALACVALVATGCATISQYANMQQPDVKLVSMQLGESSFVEQRFDIQLRVTNPNNFDLPVTGLSYDMWLNGIKFGKGVSTGDLRVPALGEKLVVLKLSTSAFDWFKQFRTMKGGVGDATLDKMKYQVKGKVFLKGLPIKSLPFVREGDVGLRGRS